ncbi:sensor histidine kinase [Fulvivirga lutimaris]|uniref:sensor histidine kinase n=1 Tax=Fulvivirga lutimaris TaxID=1819566 RepID=UPI0012BCA22B|nr:HAMP domain-containing sensor histidine kinase [Fulvivirga lutimaris]MTI38476.1 HAMP domain-containing histidine kinase [Fulvivirga lutimaris]
MKGSTIWTIIILMSVALVGLTSFQVYWINNAIQLNKKTFKENVISSLHQVATTLERREVAEMASSNMFSFYSKDNGQLRYEFKQEGFFSDGRRYVYINHDSIMPPPDPPHPSKVDVVKPITVLKHRIPNPSERIEIVVEGDTLSGPSRDSTFRVLAKAEMVNVVIENMMGPKEAHRRIDLDRVDSLLKKSLQSKGIDLHYQYAVWDADENQYLSKEKEDPSELKKSEYRAALFPNDIFENANFLLVNFPNQTSFLYKQIWTTLVASILFILIIVTCFSYAIYIIFRQKKLSDIKNDFINNMTHELKTPIATVSLAVEALNEKEMRANESTLLRYLGMIKDENTRLFNQVEKVLQSALLDKDSFSIKQEKLSMHQLITQATANLMIAIEDKKGKLELRLDAMKDSLIGDEHHLSNVLRNLIDNAIKYSAEKPSISISTTSTDNAFEINVRDNGIGMSKDTIKRIFDKFYRVPTGNRHDVKGFGLGLSYVKTIVDKHEGQIEVDSSPGKGSNFKITLPYGG